MEFDLGEDGILPPRFNEASVGGPNDEFTKIGVGILRRTIGGNYGFGKNYEFVALETQAQWKSDRATFTQT